MSYAPGAPAQIWAIPDDVLDDGAKVTLMRLWSWADHEDQRAVRKCKVYARDVEGLTYTEMLHEQLAAETGRKVRKIRRHLGKARALGLIATCGKHVWLFPPADGQALTADERSDHERSDHERAQPDHERSDADRERAQSDRKRSLQLDPPVPSSPPSPGEDARPSGKPAPFHSRCPGGGSFSCPGYRGFCGSCNEASRLAHRAARIGPVDVIERDGKPANEELPGHVEAKLARAKRERAPGAIDRAEQLADAHGFSPELLARIEATSQAAHVALMSSDCTPHTQGGKGWAALLAKNILDRGLTDDQVIRVLEAWELARASEQPKPPMGKLWWWGPISPAFVDEALASARQAAQVVRPQQTFEQAQAEAWA